MRRPTYSLGAAIAIATCAILAACGGGGGGIGTPPTTAPTTAPTGTPVVAPTTAATTAPASTSAATTVSLGSVSNGTTTVITSGAAVLPQVNTASNATVLMTASVPTGVAVPSARNERGRNLLGVANTPVAYFELTFANTVTITQSPGFSIVLPSNVTVTTGNAYLVVSSSAIPNGWQEVAGPIAAANTMTFPPAPVNPSPMTLTGGVTYTFAIVTTGSLVIAPPIATIALSVAGDIPVGASGSVPVTIVVKDTNGNTITGTYPTAITLTDTDASGQTALSATNVPDSTTAATITLTYKGGLMSAPAVIGASASGVSASNVTTASFTPDAKYPTVPATTTYVYQTSTTHGYVNATPSPASTSSATLTQTWSTGASFGGVNNLDDLHGVFSNGVNFTNRSQDSYYQWSSAAPYSLGFVATSWPGIPMTYVCSAPYEPIFIAGATSWDYLKGTGPCTQTGGGGTGTTFTGTYNADGSYTSSFTYQPQPGSTETDITTVNSDGSALETFDSSTGSVVTAIYTPAPNASTIPEYVASYPGALPSPLPSAGPANTSVPNWYVQAGLPNGVPSSPLQTGTVAASSNAALPSACAVPASLLGSNPSITKLDEPFATLDPTGYYLHGTYDSYLLNGVGTICVVEPLVEIFPGYNGSQVSQYTVNFTYYATQSTLQAAMKQRGFAQAMQAQGAMLLGAAHADRIEQLTNARRAAMLRRVQAMRQRPH